MQLLRNFHLENSIFNEELGVRSEELGYTFQTPFFIQKTDMRGHNRPERRVRRSLRTNSWGKSEDTNLQIHLVLDLAV